MQQALKHGQNKNQRTADPKGQVERLVKWRLLTKHRTHTYFKDSWKTFDAPTEKKAMKMAESFMKKGGFSHMLFTVKQAT